MKIHNYLKGYQDLLNLIVTDKKKLMKQNKIGYQLNKS